jgi:hypothetical protein
MRPIIPVSILFAVAIAASASPYPRALPDWNESRDIGVFYPSTMTQEQPSTKVALVAEPRGLGSEIPDWSPRPTFSTTADGKTQATIAVDPGTSLYGTGEVRAPMSKVGLWAFTGGECPVIIQHLFEPSKILGETRSARVDATRTDRNSSANSSDPTEIQ